MMSPFDLCQPEYAGMNGMHDLYNVLGMIPTSENADVVLIRSHIAYHSGSKAAERAVIKPSRGHSYRVSKASGIDCIVRIRNHYDHRDGVTGWTLDTRLP